MQIKKNILICPLNWGLGHATRCIPIINELNKTHNVIIASSGRSLDLLKSNFPNNKFIVFNDYNIMYPKNSLMALKMFFYIPKISYLILKENIILKQLIKENNIDIVISDNRYGLFSKKAKSIFITHQIYIKTPFLLKFLEPLIFKLNRFFIRKYDELWIPDYENKEFNLAGDLSHNFNKKSFKNIKFIGPLSRFENNKHFEKEDISDKKYDFFVIISGPEPQRTIFENIILHNLQKNKFSAVVVLGKPEENGFYLINENIEVYSNLKTIDFFNKIKNSEIVISRPGYSTIMDIAFLKKKAVFIPTPGQTEQFYLSKYYSDNNLFYSIEQEKLDLHTVSKFAKNGFIDIDFSKINNNCLINALNCL